MPATVQQAAPDYQPYHPQVSAHFSSGRTRIPLGHDFFDVTVHSQSHPRLERAFWAFPGYFWSDGFTYTRQQMHDVANMVVNGADSRWVGDKIYPGVFTILDFEPVSYQSPQWIAQRIDWFREVAPDVPIGIYGWHLDGNTLNRDMYNSTSPEWVSRVQDALEYGRPVLERLDAVVYCGYLTGVGQIERDLLYMRRYPQHIRAKFGDVPVVPFLWGDYHDSWNPPNTRIGQHVVNRYIATAVANSDALVVWGRAESTPRIYNALSGYASNAMGGPASQGTSGPIVIPPPAVPVLLGGSGGGTDDEQDLFGQNLI